MINMTREDIIRTYGDTFIGVRDGDKINPLLVREASSEANCVRGELFTVNSAGRLESTMYQLDLNSDNAWLRYPDSGAYNVLTQNTCGYVVRKAQRQWHRGIRDRHIKLTGPARFSADLVYAMFNPTYKTLAECMSHVTESDGAVAASRNWWLMSDQYKYKYPVVFFRDEIVGEVTEKGTVFGDKVVKEIFEEEFGNADQFTV